MRGKLFCLVISLLLVGCTTSPFARSNSRERSAAPGPRISEPISFTRAVVRIPAGAQVGYEFSAKGAKGARPIYWKVNLSLSDEELKLTVIDELEKHGYAVSGVDQILFGTSARERPRFLLGAIVTELAHDRHMPEAGNYSTARVAVEWQLYDNEIGKMVFKTTTQATMRKKNDSSTSTIFLAFGRAIDSLLAQEEFVALTRKRTEPALPPKPQGVVHISPCLPIGTLSLPENLEKALQAVVVVKASGSVGTGVLISQEGFVLTAHHVIQDAQEVWVEMKSGLSLEATVVGLDAEYDLALLKLAGKRHVCLPLRTGSRPGVGEEVYAVGTPAGVYDFSVSKGVISAVREIGDKTLLQTDASVNSGNSGGPLLDMTGRIMGIVTWKLRPDQGYEGIAFAVPANVAVKRLNLTWE